MSKLIASLLVVLALSAPAHAQIGVRAGFFGPSVSIGRRPYYGPPPAYNYYNYGYYGRRYYAPPPPAVYGSYYYGPGYYGSGYYSAPGVRVIVP